MDTLPAHAPVHVPLAEVDLAIEGMSCASCVRRVERALAEVPGVETASVNLATEQARVSGRGMDIAGLMEAVGRAGYAAKPVETAPRRPASPPLWPVVVAGAASLPLICGMAAEAAGARWMVPGWVQLVLASVVQFGPGARFYRGAWKALRSGAPDMDVLVALGTSAAWGLSLWALLHASPALYFQLVGADHHPDPARQVAGDLGTRANGGGDPGAVGATAGDGGGAPRGRGANGSGGCVAGRRCGCGATG